MDKYYSQTVGSLVVTESGHRVARVYDLAVNTDTGKVVGFFADSAGKKVIAPIDVIQWKSALIVHDEDCILESDEIHQVVESQKKDIRVMRNRVFTKSGEDFGRVIDFAVNNKFFTLTKLVVAKNILGLFLLKKRLIPATDIIEMKKDRIIIKDPIKTETLKAAAPAPVS